jgi:hypothetical protein
MIASLENDASNIKVYFNLTGGGLEFNGLGRHPDRMGGL